MVAQPANRKLLGYLASNLFRRGAVLAYGLRYPAAAELLLDATGPAGVVIAAPYAMDEVVQNCSCGM